ncbi:MAG: ABC transporter substrate-binding protein [Proteobacteria bacterium]|nr:ABC transporter substrate-binding protein [Pseudomonadota bacterium]
MSKICTRRTFLHYIGALSSGTLLMPLYGCNSSSPISIAAHPWPGYEFMFLARDLGWVNKELVSFKETLSASETIELLAKGEVDAGALTLDEVLRARESGIALSVVLLFDISAGADIVLAKPAIKHLSQIKGKRIGVELSAVGAIMLDQLLKKAGLSKTDISIVELSIDKQLQAWKSDRIDIVITYEPIASQLQAFGATKLFSSSEAPDLIFDVLAVREDRLNHTNAIIHIINAHFKAQNHFYNNKEDALYRLASRLGLASRKVPSAYQGLILPSYNNNLRLLSGDNPAIIKKTQKLISVMQKNHLLDQNASTKDLFTNTFIQRLYNEN